MSKRRVRVFAVMLLCLCVRGYSEAVADVDSEVSELKVYVGKWLDVEEELAGEERGWREKRAQLQRELDLLERRNVELDKALSVLQQHDEPRDEQLEALLMEVREGEKVLQSIEALTSRASFLLEESLKFVPKVMAEQVEYEKDGGSGVTRLHRTLAGYASLERLAHSIHVVRELLQVEEQEHEMDVLYMGISRAYAVARDGGAALLGETDATGNWIWQDGSAYAAEIRAAVDIFEMNEDIRLVELPLHVEVDP